MDVLLESQIHRDSHNANLCKGVLSAKCLKIIFGASFTSYLAFARDKEEKNAKKQTEKQKKQIRQSCWLLEILDA